MVTGAARGIGRNIARTLTQAGAHVVVVDIDSETGQLTANDLANAGSASYLHADLTTDDGPERAIESVINEFGRLDVLVNNARSRPTERHDLLSEDRHSWDSTMVVTLRGTFFMSRAAIRHWSNTPTQGAAIVNIASILGTMAGHEAPSYHAAKGGVVQLTRYLADAGGQYGVRVNAVSPGLIVQDEHQERFARADNELYRTSANELHPVGRVGASDDVADAVLFLASPRSSYISGQILTVDGGASGQEQWTLKLRNTPGLS